MKKKKLLMFILVIILLIISALFFYNLGSKNALDDKDDVAEKYNITVNSTSGGSVASSLTEAEEGEEIILTLTEETDHKFKEWEVISGDIEIEDNKFDMPATDVSIKAIFEKEAPKIAEVTDKAFLNNVLNKFSGRLGYEYCSLDLNVLKEIYSGNMDVNYLGNNTMFLIVVNKENIDIDPGTTLSKNYLNKSLREILYTNKDINFNIINDEINIYHYENFPDDKINLSINIFGCVDNMDDLRKVLIRGEEEDNYLYIYERVAFGKNTHDGNISYFKDPGLNELVQVVKFDLDFSSIKVKMNDFNLYKYTFIKADNTYKLMKIEKQ